MAADADRESDFSFFEIPNWGVRLVVLLLVIGFPVALILAWAFELTPEGIKRTEVADKEPAKRAGHRAWIYIVLIGAALSVGIFFSGAILLRANKLSQPSCLRNRLRYCRLKI